jgi:hypothetical protein
MKVLPDRGGQIIPRPEIAARLPPERDRRVRHGLLEDERRAKRRNTPRKGANARSQSACQMEASHGRPPVFIIQVHISGQAFGERHRVLCSLSTVPRPHEQFMNRS